MKLYNGFLSDAIIRFVNLIKRLITVLFKELIISILYLLISIKAFKIILGKFNKKKVNKVN